jgi:hypothetical protein
MGTPATGPTNLQEPRMKRAGVTTKRPGVTTKGFVEELTGKHSEFGAYGDYTVTTPSGPVEVDGAIAVRVLDHGELNFITDTGRWLLFAANSWTRVIPTQPTTDGVA